MQDVYWGSTPEKGKGKKQDWAEKEKLNYGAGLTKPQPAHWGALE